MCVCVCVCVREEASFCAVVDGDGELGDFLRLPHIMKRRGGWNRDDAELKVTTTLLLLMVVVVVNSRLLLQCCC